ncbi:Holliday junction resolvase RuvX [Pseudoteredinibacter isoporae]|uniref:Putative pre-16S rRNA nuclease n=1 Tax=Pseudoteredinibacter isoporae TaxID=570281 RepID=A0A7X0JPG8_9GAMM|nr:Holliday junction resolvase RuvX [Pseudoteredinibacter isoporae]MBB6519897.1 putative Holliday junction resolvase [Pseudoteredinibacter isoporae]NHO85475.1 Holliday junction resolvase RuvX [Pseudoteredinibacter isoporae]NIB26073.1 Holliday junction resolvase RuvX [Pseudoteredinibacter isoporae]
MSNIKTVLAFDYGLRNIGLAQGNRLSNTSQELKPLKAKDGTPNWDEIKKILEEWQPDLVVVGLPLNMDDSESELSKRARKFANRLHGRFGVAIEMMDERLSSFEAKEEASERGQLGNYSKQPIDSIAARLILESWLASQPI